MYPPGHRRALAGNNPPAHLCERRSRTQGSVRGRGLNFGDHIGDAVLFALERFRQWVVAHLLILLAWQGPRELQPMSRKDLSVARYFAVSAYDFQTKEVGRA